MPNRRQLKSLRDSLVKKAEERLHDAQKQYEAAKKKYEEEMLVLSSAFDVILKMKNIASLDTGDDDETTYTDKIKAVLKRQPKDTSLGSKAIARLTGIDIVAVRTALYKAKPNPFEKVRTGERRVRWKLKDESGDSKPKENEIHLPHKGPNEDTKRSRPSRCYRAT